MEDNKNRTFLLGDIGGTNSRIQIYQNFNDEAASFESRYKTGDFTKMEELLDKVIVDYPDLEPKNTIACVGIASFVKDNKATITANYDWEETNGDKMKEHYGKFSHYSYLILFLGFIEFRLLNDFVACGYSLTGLDTQQVVNLTPHLQPFADIDLKQFQKYVFVGPGTGLGVCQCVVT